MKHNIDLLREDIRLGMACTTENKGVLDSISRRVGPDIEILCRYRVDAKQSRNLLKSDLDILKLTEKEALQIGLQNTIRDGYMLESLPGMIERMGGPTEEGKETPAARAYVFTNPDEYFGASALFVSREIREEIHDRMGGDFYVLPSSIHECILIRDSEDVDPDELREMVRSINSAVVSPDDKLSDEVYFVDERYRIQAVDAEAEEETGKYTEEETLSAQAKMTI